MRKVILSVLAACSLSFATVAGTANGTAKTAETVLSGQTDVYSKVFVGGEQAGAMISGDGDTDLDLYVYDSNDNLICKSETYGDDEVCNWIPLWTGRFTVKIKNRGEVYNDYTILLY